MIFLATENLHPGFGVKDVSRRCHSDTTFEATGHLWEQLTPTPCLAGQHDQREVFSVRAACPSLSLEHPEVFARTSGGGGGEGGGAPSLFLSRPPSLPLSGPLPLAARVGSGHFPEALSRGGSKSSEGGLERLEGATGEGGGVLARSNSEETWREELQVPSLHTCHTLPLYTIHTPSLPTPFPTLNPEPQHPSGRLFDDGRAISGEPQPQTPNTPKL